VLLTTAFELGGRTAPSRVLFGPHETNLGTGRGLSDRHVAYYRERALGGAGVIVTETASVHDSDWPYERAPLAAECGPGWRAVKDACGSALVLASLGHTGNQGSSAYSQAALWGASAVADAVNRELPQVMEQREISLLTRAFAAAAALAVASGCDGVEVEAGDRSLLRQFLSGVTNQRGDGYGEDKARLLREVLVAVREAVPGALLSLRLSCDELAPWAGITPENVQPVLAAVAPLVDLLVVVRAGPFAGSAYRPDAHAPEAFNRDLCASVKAAVDVPVVLQGSVVSRRVAESALQDGVADLVEMTRAQIAEPRLVELLRAGETPRPCVLCNQGCRVRDPRNPIVSCIGEPRSGHETRDALVPEQSPPQGRDVLVVGGGPAGLECARVAALRGRRVVLREMAPVLGGAVNDASLGIGRERLRQLTDWLAAECERLGVELRVDSLVTEDEIAEFPGDVVVCTGSRRRPALPYEVPVLDSRQALRGLASDGPVLVLDPVGGPVGVSVAETLAERGREVRLVTQDPVVGTLLSLTGDLADCNTRLQQRGVPRELKSLLRRASGGTATLEDVWTGVRRQVPCSVVVDCGHRLPDDTPGARRAGDCVAPRTILEAVLEGRRQALAL
jgi:mycofactocin system FadH/OYE family oxidoreductase 1